MLAANVNSSKHTRTRPNPLYSTSGLQTQATEGGKTEVTKCTEQSSTNCTELRMYTLLRDGYQYKMTYILYMSKTANGATKVM